MTQWLPSLSLLATGLGLTSGMKEHAAAASPDRAAYAATMLGTHGGVGFHGAGPSSRAPRRCPRGAHRMAAPPAQRPSQ